jgi:hypothetical protein
MAGHPFIVRIEEGDEIIFRQLDPMIPGQGRTPVILFNQDDSWIRKTPDNFRPLIS